MALSTGQRAAVFPERVSREADSLMNHTHPRRPVCRAARRSGFTLVEIMIVVLIIGVLLNIAAPALVSARDKGQSKSCVKNLSNFMTAKEQYVMDNKIPSSSTSQVTWPNIAPYIHVLPGTDPVNGPNCPSRGDSYGGFLPVY